MEIDIVALLSNCRNNIFSVGLTPGCLAVAGVKTQAIEGAGKDDLDLEPV